MAQPNQSPIDPRKPPGNLQPASHSTGGAKDHTAADEANEETQRHSSAPSMARKDEPMSTQHPSTTPRQDPKQRVRRDESLPPDEDT